jgi:hypothetical protein
VEAVQPGGIATGIDPGVIRDATAKCILPGFVYIPLISTVCNRGQHSRAWSSTDVSMGAFPLGRKVADTSLCRNHLTCTERAHRRFYGQVDWIRKLWPNSWQQAKDCLLRYN